MAKKKTSSKKVAIKKTPAKKTAVKKISTQKAERFCCANNVNFFLVLLFCFIFATVFLAAFF